MGVFPRWADLFRRSAWLRWVGKWGVSCASLVLGLLTLFVFRRGLPAVSWIVGYLLLLWGIFVVFTQARAPLEARGHRRVLSAADYTVQTLYHNLFLFVLPPLAVLAGVTMSSFLDSRFPLTLRGLSLGMVLVSAVITVADLAKLHPYEYVYFNRLAAGGEQAGAQRFETDYWGTSYKEGVAWLVDHYRPDSRERTRVANCSRQYLTGYYLEKGSARLRFVSVERNEEPQIFLSTTRFNCQTIAGGETLHVVERVGVPMVYVNKIRD